MFKEKVMWFDNTKISISKSGIVIDNYIDIKESELDTRYRHLYITHHFIDGGSAWNGVPIYETSEVLNI